MESVVAPNIIINRSIASRLENAKNIVEIKQTLADAKGKVLMLGVHTAFVNLNRLAINEWRGKKNVLKKYEMNYTRIFKENIASFDKSVFVLHGRFGDIGSTSKVFKRHGVPFSPQAVVADSETGRILPHKNKDGKIVAYATADEMDAICNVISKTDKWEAVLGFGMYRDKCVTHGMEDFAVIMENAGYKEVPVVTNRILAKNRADIF